MKDDMDMILKQLAYDGIELVRPVDRIRSFELIPFISFLFLHKNIYSI